MNKYLKILIYILPWTIAIPLIFVVHSCELSHSTKVKITFSEISQIRDDRKHEGVPVDPMTVYLTETNDMIMKVYEAWVVSQKTYSYDMEKSFAFEMDMILNKTFKFHKKDLEDLLVDVVANTKVIMEEMKMIPSMFKELSSISSQADNIWRETEREEYHYEYYQVQVCSSDSKGRRSCHSETRSRKVCDYIDYTYHYNSITMGNVIRESEEFLSRNYEIPKLELLLKPASKTNAEGEYIVEQTRSKEEFEFDLKNYKSDWIHKSVFMQNIPHIRKDLGDMSYRLNGLVEASKTSKTTKYRDHFCGSGKRPSEMRVAESYSNFTGGIATRLRAIWSGFTTTLYKTPVLGQLSREFVAYKRDGGKIERTSDEVLDVAGEILRSNFNGMDIVVPYRTWLVIISGIFLIGLAIAGNWYFTVFLTEM